MKTSKLSPKNLLNVLILTSGAVLGLISGLTEVSLAQTADDLGYPTNERNPMTTTSGGLNPLQLMHQLQLSNGRTMTEFMIDSQENINNAADDFKRQQQILIEQQTEAANNAENTNITAERDNQ